MRRFKMKREDLKVPAEKLRFNCDPEILKASSEVEPLKDNEIIVQKRAIEALQFGLEIEAVGYNVFVTGLPNTGRTSLILQLIKDFAKRKGNKAVKDLCYVYNFSNPDKPKLIILNKGEGKKLKNRMANLCTMLKKKIPKIFQTQEYLKAVNEIENQVNQRIAQLQAEVDAKIKAMGYRVEKDFRGSFRLVPSSFKNKGKSMSQEERDTLNPEQEKELVKKETEIKQILLQAQLKANQLEEEAMRKIQELEEKTVSETLKPIFATFPYKDKSVREYLGELEKWIAKNLDFFMPQKGSIISLTAQGSHDSNLPFQVNVLVDNSNSDAAPVIIEHHPSFANLFGKIEKKFVQGGFVTDHTKIKAGSLIMANGGYLIVDAYDLLTNPGVWQKLKKTLGTGFLEVEDIYHYYGYSVEGLDPEPIPIDVKVVVICEPWLYYLLTVYDENFLNVFKVKAEFDYQVNLDQEQFQNYIRFISFCCQQENLLPFEKGAVAKVIEYSIRLVSDQKKISTQFGKIKDILIEANYWAEKDGASAVKAEHVKKAIDEKRERVKSIEEHYQEYIKRGIFLVDTDGEKVGQVNGLAVFDIDPPFGLPQKITAQTFAGGRGVISIQRQVGLAGPIHNTGVEILSNYLSARYAQEESLSFSVSICFEQNYSKIEGDSATAAELIAIISSLANLPVDQSLAITGSMNQKGEIQPIGGVNEKIEGFFDTCQAKGLTGRQGVVIPIQNIDNLMLREDVVEAVKNGKFSIYAVKTIEEAIELLLNKDMNEVDKLIKERVKKSQKKKKNTSKEDKKKEDKKEK